MKSYWILLIVALSLNWPVAVKAQNGYCGKGGGASVPPSTFNQLSFAAKLPDPQKSARAVLAIAQRRGSGLRVAFVLRDRERVLDYVIVARRAGCTVATMHFTAGGPRRF